ncbi:hypothetical protein [Falsiruegeria mediterranea]|uniref:Uncharacterized protein n=1 Tax=Falsiruegeria mediterranea M17 TaxID=1200281 RepID=A0A2R8CFB9_9RHOB|nr:hypothetical protein [Falsiruegeria mediterranea]SPJ31117.1 hypothetical protein TRM7615_04657 [Falsiruegeria mediterranea M17]
MTGALLVTTSTQGLQPLGSAAQRSFELVATTIRQRLGAEHAALFAEPVVTDHGDQIDWYAHVGGKAQRLSDLPPPEQAVVKATLGRLVGEIMALADTLRNSDQPDDQRLGEAWANAVEIPADSMIHVVEGEGGLQPVLVHWAWVRDEQHGVRGILTAMVPRAVPLTPHGDDRPGRFRLLWWWLIVLGWLLLAAILALILWLMLAPCALAPWGPDHCRPEASALSAVYSEQQVAQERIARLEHEIALTDRACRAEIPVLPATPEPQTKPESKPEPKPEQKGALPPSPDETLRRLAGRAQALYTRLNPFSSAN